NIAYFETNNSYRNVMTWWLAPGAAGGAPTINFGTGNLGPNNQWSGEFSLNQWHQVAFHILWTTNAANGTIKFWFDGKLVRDLKLATKPDGNSLFFQAGIHRASRNDAVDSIFFDNFIEADALADLKIIEGGADGGVSPPADAGAATDTSTPGTGGSSGGSGGNQGAGQTGGTSGGGSGGASGNGSGGSGGAVSSGGTTGAGTGGTGSGSSGGSSGSSGRGGSSGSAAKPSVGYGCSFAGDANLGGGAWLSLLALMSVGWRLGRRRTRQPAGRPQ
ncbi:MAG TPA: heparin lyase I family protein, partial [Polyangia bacterium]